MLFFRCCTVNANVVVGFYGGFQKTVSYFDTEHSLQHSLQDSFWVATNTSLLNMNYKNYSFSSNKIMVEKIYSGVFGLETLPH